MTNGVHKCKPTDGGQFGGHIGYFSFDKNIYSNLSKSLIKISVPEKCERNTVINNQVGVSTSAAIFVAILVIVHRTKPIYKLGREFDKASL